MNILVTGLDCLHLTMDTNAQFRLAGEIMYRRVLSLFLSLTMVLTGCATVPSNPYMAEVQRNPAVCNTIYYGGTDARSKGLQEACLNYDPNAKQGVTAGDVVAGAVAVVLLVGLVALTAGASSYSNNSYNRRDGVTKYEYDRNGQIGRVRTPYYDKRIRYNRAGRVREVTTERR